MFDQTQIKQSIQAAEQAWYACPHQTCLIRGCPNEKTHRPSSTRTKEQHQQTNTIKQHQTKRKIRKLEKLEKSFSEYFDLRTLLRYLHFIQVTIHLSFIHIIYHFDMLCLAVWQDTCHTHQNLVYGLAHHESPIAQWLERPTGILESHGFDSRWGLRKIFF